jgi:3-oxoacyl-[acyl-carrier-protein] synthase III
MGVIVSSLECCFEYGEDYNFSQFPKQVLSLASKVLEPIIKKNQVAISHLVLATTCPDTIAPSLGQEINRYFYPYFKGTQVFDLVQGCAGGVSALILGYKLAFKNPLGVMVVVADAAKKSIDPSYSHFSIFGNGAYAALLSNLEGTKGLIHCKSSQFPEITEVVQVGMGHDIVSLLHHEDLNLHPRKYLGLRMNDKLALSLIQKAGDFYEEFLEEVKMLPDYIVFHQVNPKIMAHLTRRFTNNHTKVIDISRRVGNCGAASVGIALKLEETTLKDKKVLICSFGTGGVITAGLWQF